MKNRLGFAALVACLLAYSTPHAHAETLLGRLVVNDGGTVANPCSGWVAYKGDAGAFAIPSLAKITVQCDSAAYVLNDVAGCDAGTCFSVAAGEKLPLSIYGNKNLTCKAFASDGGVAGHSVTYNGGWVAMAPSPTAAAGAVTTCFVYSRSGSE